MLFSGQDISVLSTAGRSDGSRKGCVVFLPILTCLCKSWWWPGRRPRGSTGWLRVCGQWCSKCCSLLSEHLAAPLVHREACWLCYLWKRWDEGVSLSWPLMLLCSCWVWNVGCRSWVKFQCKCIPIYFSSWVYLVCLLFSLSERAEGAAVHSWADGSFCPRDRSMAEHRDSYVYRSAWLQAAV